MASPDENKVRLRALIRELRDDLGISYEELARRLEAHGVKMEPRALNNRLNRGNFSGGFAITVLQALGARHLDIPEAPKRLKAPK